MGDREIWRRRRQMIKIQRRMNMANEIGSVKGINGTSTALNGQSGYGAVKPSASGNSSPGGTKPDKPADASVPMPK